MVVISAVGIVIAGVEADPGGEAVIEIGGVGHGADAQVAEVDRGAETGAVVELR